MIPVTKFVLMQDVKHVFKYNKKCNFFRIYQNGKPIQNGSTASRFITIDGDPVVWNML